MLPKKKMQFSFYWFELENIIRKYFNFYNAKPNNLNVNAKLIKPIPNVRISVKSKVASSLRYSAYIQILKKTEQPNLVQDFHRAANLLPQNPDILNSNNSYISDHSPIQVWLNGCGSVNLNKAT